jgi:hypothetical protein
MLTDLQMMINVLQSFGCVEAKLTAPYGFEYIIKILKNNDGFLLLIGEGYGYANFYGVFEFDINGKAKSKEYKLTE